MYVYSLNKIDFFFLIDINLIWNTKEQIHNMFCLENCLFSISYITHSLLDVFHSHNKKKEAGNLSLSICSIFSFMPPPPTTVPLLFGIFIKIGKNLYAFGNGFYN